MINQRIDFGPLFMFQGLQYTHRRTVDVTRYKSDSNSLLQGNRLQLFNQPISFFLLLKDQTRRSQDRARVKDLVITSSPMVVLL
jgi:hypothetical protein